MKQRSIVFNITKNEKMMLKEVVFLEPFLQHNLDHARKEGADFRISFDSSDLFDLISALNYFHETMASHEKKIKIEEFIVKLIPYLKIVTQPEDKLGS